MDPEKIVASTRISPATKTIRGWSCVFCRIFFGNTARSGHARLRAVAIRATVRQTAASMHSARLPDFPWPDNGTRCGSPYYVGCPRLRLMPVSHSSLRYPRQILDGYFWRTPRSLGLRDICQPALSGGAIRINKARFRSPPPLIRRSGDFLPGCLVRQLPRYGEVRKPVTPPAARKSGLCRGNPPTRPTAGATAKTAMRANERASDGGGGRADQPFRWWRNKLSRASFNGPSSISALRCAKPSSAAGGRPVFSTGWT